MGINRLAYTHFPQSCVFVDLHKYTQYIVADWKKYIYLVFTVDSVHLLCYNRDTSLMDINYPGLRGRGQTERGKDYV